MSEIRNTIIAITLSTLVLLFWQKIYEKPQIETKEEVAQNSAESTIDNEIELYSDRVDALATNGPRISIISDKLNGSISLKGLRIDDLQLNKYKESVKKDAAGINLLSPINTEDSYFIELGWLSKDKMELPNQESIWSTNKQSLRARDKVNLTWQNEAGIIFGVKISLDSNYMFKIQQSIANTTAETINIINYGRINRNRDINQNFYKISHEGFVGAINSSVIEQGYSALAKAKEPIHFKLEKSPNKSWVGFSDKYWFTALIPEQNHKINAKLQHTKHGDYDKFQVNFVTHNIAIPGGKTQVFTSYAFAGPKELALLDDYKKSLNITLFDHAVDFGYLYFITKPIFILLCYFHNLLGNFGLAILLLTVCVKTLMLPLANKGYRSMQNLKKIQPKISEAHKTYNKDKMRANQEIMSLMKKHKVNPFSGFLPLILQIPIFFALYKVLFITIEMRHAPFFGWIKDLSAPDPTNIFNLFGLVPITLPPFLEIGAWPLILGCTMIIQQKFNPAPQDPTHARIITMLPFVLVFVFSSFPAGLIIYWTWSNILSIIQQFIITRIINKQVVKA
jgi:YidC/Oxa1 family membrane protein insertase